MPINVTITADSTEELRVLLRGFTTILQEGSISGITVTAPSPDETPAPPKRSRKPVESTNPAASDTEETNTDSSEDAVAVTLEELRAKVAAVAQSGKQPQVKALLTKFESDSVSKLPEDKRSAFLKELEALK